MHALVRSEPLQETAPMDPQPKPHQLMDLPVDRVEPDPDQVRQTFDPGVLDNLAASLKASGQLIPILAYRAPDRDAWVILDGERRWRAAKLARLATIKAEVLPYRPSPEEALLMQVSIDQQREALDAIEQSIAYRRLLEANQWSPTTLAKTIAVSLSTITRAIDLLDLPESLQALVKSRELPVNIARELARLADDSALLESAWARVRDEKLSQSATAKLVSSMLARPKGAKRGPKAAKKWTFRNLSGYNALVTSKKVTLVACKKGPGAEDVLAALEALVVRFRDEVARIEAKAEPQEGAVHA